MSDNDVTIYRNTSTFIGFTKTPNLPISKFTLRLDGGDVELDYSDGRNAIAEAGTLEVLASAQQNTPLHVVLDWSSFSTAPTLTPSPSLPTINVSTDVANKQTTLEIPVPTAAHAWYIWDTIGGEIPGFNLKVKVKRKV